VISQCMSAVGKRPRRPLAHCRPRQAEIRFEWEHEKQTSPDADGVFTSCASITDAGRSVVQVAAKMVAAQ
jgi:hypothetical protein